MTSADSLYFFSGWLAGSPGAARAFGNARWFDIEIVPEGSSAPVFSIEPKASKAYWSLDAPTDEELAGWIGVSPNMKTDPTFAQWLVPVGKLAPGTYTIEAEFGMLHSITDLGDYYLRSGDEGSDHKPDIYPKFIFSGTNTITLTVTP